MIGETKGCLIGVLLNLWVIYFYGISTLAGLLNALSSVQCLWPLIIYDTKIQLHNHFEQVNTLLLQTDLFY